MIDAISCVKAYTAVLYTSVDVLAHLYDTTDSVVARREENRAAS